MNRREFLKKSLEGIVIESIPVIYNCEKNPVKYSIPIDFETISKGHWCEITEKKFLVINNYEGLNKMWKEAFERQFSPPNVPNTDFLEYTILAVYMGNCPTTGYEINISDITESNNAIFVRVSEKTPQGGVGQAITQPYHIVKTTKLKKQVIFE